jgi:transposase-like protein
VGVPQPDRCCRSCGRVLATDNREDRCGPCTASTRPALGGPVLSTGVGLRLLTQRWADGFDAFRATAGTDAAGAARLAFTLDLVPARWRLTEADLVVMATERRAPTTDLARRFGVSRWTVAAWRSSLGLTRRPAPRPPSPPKPLVVRGVRVTCRPRVRVVGPGGPVRLGRAARAVLTALAEAHPAPVDADALRAVAFPELTPERGRAALHSALWRLRQHLPSDTIQRFGDGYRLAVATDAVER